MADLFSGVTDISPIVERNAPYARSGPYRTQLPADQEAAFKKWIAGTGENPDDNSYDYRGFYKAMLAGSASTAANQEGEKSGTKKIYFPDRFKTPMHPTFSSDSIYWNRQKIPEREGGLYLIKSDGTPYFIPDSRSLDTSQSWPPKEVGYDVKGIPLAQANGKFFSGVTKAKPEEAGPPVPKQTAWQRLTTPIPYGKAEIELEAEEAAHPLWNLPSELAAKKTQELLAPKIGEEPARLASSAVSGALTPIPGVGTAGRMAYGLGATATADLAQRITGNPTVAFLASMGVPLIAGHLLNHAYMTEPVERAEGMPPKVGPQATLEAQEAPKEAAPETPTQQPETQAPKPETAAEIPEPSKADADVMAAQETNPKGSITEYTVGQLRKNPELMQVDADRFQFKGNTDAAGVGEKERIKQFKPGYAGVMTAYHTPEGDFIINGHHRLDAALKTGADSDALRFQWIDAGDGSDLRAKGIQPIETNVSDAGARLYGAVLNIADQRGTAIDMAKVMREGNLTGQSLESLGLNMSEARTSDARGLANLSPFLWKQVVNENLKPSLGVVLGQELEGMPEAQNDLYKMVADKKYSASELRDLIRLSRTSDTFSEQESLFGKDFLKKSTLPQQVKILDSARDDLSKNARMMSSAAKGKASLETAGETKIDQPELLARAHQARQLEELLPKFAYQADSATNGVIKQLAYDLAAQPKNKASILENARIRIPEALKTDARNMGLQIEQPPVPEGPSPQAGLFGGGAQGTELSGGIVPVQAVRKAQSLARAASAKLESSRPVTWLKIVFAPETRGAFAERATAIQEEQAAELRARVGSARVALEPFKDYMRGIEPAQRWNIYSQIEQGNMDILPPEIRPAVQAARDAFEKSIQEVGKVRGGEVGYIENYLPHLYADAPETVRDTFRELRQATGKSLQGSTKFTKQRLITLMTDAIQKGLTPKFDNPADMMLAGLQNQWRYITGQRIFQSLKDAGLATFLPEGKQLPKGMAYIDDRIAQVRHFSPEAGGMVARGAYIAPEEAGLIINNYTSPSKPMTPFRSVSAIGNTLRQEISAFHMMLEANSLADIEAGGALQEGLGKLAHGDLKGGLSQLADLPKYWLTVPEAYRILAEGRNIMKEGLAGHLGDPVVRDVIMSGASFDYGDSILSENLTRAFGDKLGLPGKVLKNVLGGVMKQVVVPMKLGAFKRLYARELQNAITENGGEDLTYVQRRAVVQGVRRHLDTVMGQIARDNLHTTNSLKDWIGQIVAYPGWNIGTLRLFGGIGRGIYQFATEQKLDQQARLALQYAAGKILRAGIQGALMNKFITGEWPKNIYEAYTWPTGQKDTNGNWIRVTPPEYLVRDLLSFIGHERKQDPNDILGPAKALTEVALSKANWPLAVGYEIYKNADFFGKPIYFQHAESMPKQAAEIMGHIAKAGGLPFSLSNVSEQQRQAGEPTGPVGFVKEAMTHPSQALRQAAVGVSGLTPAARSLRQTPMQNYVDMIEQNQIRTQATNPGQLKTEEANRQLRAAMRQFRSGQTKTPPDPKAYLKAMAGAGVPPQQAAKQYLTEWKQSKLSPLEAALHRIPATEVARAWEIAKEHDDEHDMALAKRVLIQKWKSPALKPQERQSIAPMLRRILVPEKKEESAGAKA